MVSNLKVLLLKVVNVEKVAGLSVVELDPHSLSLVWLNNEWVTDNRVSRLLCEDCLHPDQLRNYILVALFPFYLERKDPQHGLIELLHSLKPLSQP